MMSTAARKAAAYLRFTAFVLIALMVSFAHPGFAQPLPAPARDMPPTGSGMQTIVLAGGCFWGMQDVFQHVKGVKQAVSGYTGGAADTAHYEQVSSGTTGHAESVQVTYDPAEVTLGKLLQIYFAVAHDPTELDYQGPDHGTQYRSAIFYASPKQKQVAQAYIAELGQDKAFPGPIVTKLEPLTEFYPAEDYHQNYARLHPDNGYIAVNDTPKVEALKREFPASYKD